MAFATILTCGALLLISRPGEVLDTDVYRSGQPSVGRLHRVISEFELRTVVNLRDAPDDRAWLRNEREVCAEAGVVHHTVRGLEPHGWPPQASVRHLADLLDSAERPLLLHCYRGVDRTGWASAVAAALDGAPLDDAVGQLSLLKGHACWRPSCPPHLFFESYRRFLEKQGVEHTGPEFRRWALTEYAPDPYDAEIELLEDLPRDLRAGERTRVRARATNRGAAAWRLDGAAGIRLGVRAISVPGSPPVDPAAVFRASEEEVLELGRSARGTGWVESGDRHVFEIRMRAFPRPGTYLVQIDLVEPGVNWFSELGGPGVLVDLEVIP